MLGFFKKLFGSTPVETPAPYKVEAPVAKAESAPSAPKKTAKKPAVKKATTRKPKV